MALAFIVIAVLGYLLGALPFGYWVAKAKGVDIFQEGSRSSGATNVRRTVGAAAGNLVLFLDALKGAVATALPAAYQRWGPVPDGAGFDEIGYKYLCAVGLLSAILGHSFSCFTRFKGGKGVATAAGGYVVLFPVGIAVALTVWVLAVVITRYVSVASILAAASLPVTAYYRGEAQIILWVCVTVAVFVIYRHRANIRRLIAGTEPRFGRKKS